jgi:hypothetical protein
LFDWFGVSIDINSVLNQLSWDTWHVSWLPSEDIFVVQKKVGEREFLFSREVSTDGLYLLGITSTQVNFLHIGSFGGARMQGFLARISSSSGFIYAAMVAISSLPSAACALAVIWIA